jgi:hypothetical protein
MKQHQDDCSKADQDNEFLHNICIFKAKHHHVLLQRMFRGLGIKSDSLAKKNLNIKIVRDTLFFLHITYFGLLSESRDGVA